MGSASGTLLSQFPVSYLAAARAKTMGRFAPVRQIWGCFQHRHIAALRVLRPLCSCSGGAPKCGYRKRWPGEEGLLLKQPPFEQSTRFFILPRRRFLVPPVRLAPFTSRTLGIVRVLRVEDIPSVPFRMCSCEGEVGCVVADAGNAQQDSSVDGCLG